MMKIITVIFMSDKVYVIVDCSGKMMELGKNHLLVYLLITACNLLQEYELFSWSSSVSSLESPYLDPKADFGDRVDTKALSDFMTSLEENARVLLLSDGNFSGTSIVKSLKKHKIQLITLAVGADCSKSTLDSLCIIKKAYDTSDINAAVYALRYGISGGKV